MASVQHLITFTFYLITCTVLSDRYIDWFNIDCPGSVADSSCTYTNPNAVDIAISLFFQSEDNSGSSFQCTSTTARAPSVPFECPSPMKYVYSDFWSYCLLEDLTFPSDLSKVDPYCEYIDQGYEGFTFQQSDFPSYKCPSSMNQGNNNEGTIFCTYTLPQNTVKNLPNDTQPFCTLQAFQSNELGFRFDNNGSTPTPTLDVNNAVYCARTWNDQQTGSAGDCYFVLPAKESFACSGKGTTNIIGAHGTKLQGANFAKGSSKITSVASYTNDKATDAWIYLEIESTGKNVNDFSCTYMTNKNTMINLVNFTTDNSPDSIYSFNFILPSNKTMKCVISGNIHVNSGVVRSLTTSMLSNSEPMTNVPKCPNSTYPLSTMCDCYFQNPSNNDDALIIMEAVNEDNQFNSYHCYVWGVNVCAWGANNNNLNDGGGCYFILPAGSMYNCSMEWGATSFLESTVLQLDGSIYPKQSILSVYHDGNDIKGTKLTDSRSINEMNKLWNKWKLNQNKHYSTKNEEIKRFNNFKKYVSLMDNNNNGKQLNEILNDNADLSINEFNELYRGCSLPLDVYDKDKQLFKVPADIDLSALPASVDWRTQGVITPIKNQGQCGSCWSFSTTGVLSSHWAIAKGKSQLQSLSEQELVSCEDDCYGCNGGWPYKAISWVATNNIDTEESYNYTSGNGNVASCQKQNGIQANIRVKSYQFVESNEDAMAAYVANYGPISVSLDAMTQIWWPYTSSSGIMNGCCNKTPDHAVLIIGYGVSNSSSNGEQYWIIKNSWGTDWGYDGYLYLQKGTDQCGITVQPVVPVLQT